MVGRDHIDIGYDLFVEPDHRVYRGARFHVQVKGTLQPDASRISAKVNRSRLHQYAQNILPVFIVRATRDLDLYWIHAQAWAVGNSKFLVGEGSRSLRFDARNSLSDRAAFEAYLQTIVGSLPVNIEALKPSLMAWPRAKKGASSLPIDKHPSGEPALSNSTLQTVEATVSFRTSAGDENWINARDAFAFGLPAPVEVEDFCVELPDFGDGRKIMPPLSGRLTVQTEPRATGVVQFFPGRNFSMLAQDLSLDSDLFTGMQGIGISNANHSSVIDLTVRIALKNDTAKPTVNLAMRRSALCSQPIQFLDELRFLHAWVDQVIAHGAVSIEIAFNDQRDGLSPMEGSIDPLRPFLHAARSLSRLHLVARSLKSHFKLDDSAILSSDDVDDINMAFELLRGTRIPIELGPIEFTPSGTIDPDIEGDFYCTTMMSISVAGARLGEIPIGIELPGRRLEEVEGTTRYRIVAGADSKTWMSYSEHGDQGNAIARRAG